MSKLAAPSMTSPAIAATVAIARSLAAAHPSATLPCPACEATVNAGNLERHLGKVHATALQASPVAGGVRLTGVDHRIRWPLSALPILWLIGVIVVFAIGGPITDATMAIVGASLLLACAPLTAAVLGVFRAHIELDGEQVRLRWAFGATTIALPAKLESGRLIERRADVLDHQQETGTAHDETVGVYLRLSQGGATVTVGAKQGAGLGKHWAAKGWSSGPKRRSCDITVDRSALVAVEYLLAARGLLLVRDA
jgi:hypothetical protein